MKAQLAWFSLLEAHREWGRMPLSDLLLLLSVRIDDTLSVTEHGEKAGMIKQVAGNIFDRLAKNDSGRRIVEAEGRGMIEKAPHPTDARSYVPKLTPKGKAFVSRLLAGLVSMP